MWGRTLERKFPHTEPVASRTARIQHWYVLCYFGLEKLKKKKAMLVTSTKGRRLLEKTPSLYKNTTIKYLRCVIRVANKSYCKLLYVCLSVYLSAWNSSYVSGQNFVVFYIEEFLLQFEKIQIGLESDKNIRHFRCDLVLALRESPIRTNTATYLRKTALSRAKGVYCIGWERSDCGLCAPTNTRGCW